MGDFKLEAAWLTLLKAARDVGALNVESRLLELRRELENIRAHKNGEGD